MNRISSHSRKTEPKIWIWINAVTKLIKINASSSLSCYIKNWIFPLLSLHNDFKEWGKKREESSLCFNFSTEPAQLSLYQRETVQRRRIYLVRAYRRCCCCCWIEEKRCPRHQSGSRRNMQAASRETNEIIKNNEKQKINEEFYNWWTVNKLGRLRSSILESPEFLKTRSEWEFESSHFSFTSLPVPAARGAVLW